MLFFTGPNKGYTVGFSGTILNTTSGGTSISEFHATSPGIMVYPVPSSDKITIELQNDISLKGSRFYLYDLHGSLVAEQAVRRHVIELGFSGFKSVI